MSLENPLSILYNSEGHEIAVSQSQTLTGSGTQPGFMVMGSGSDGNAHYMRVSNDGSVFITGSVAANFSPEANTPVSQGLPGGISDAWNIKITDGTQVLGTGSSAPVWVSGAVTVGGTVNVGNFPSTQAVSVSNFPATQSVDGTVNVGNFPTVQTVTGVVGFQNNQGESTNPFWVTGSVTTNFDPSTSATVTPVSASVTVVTLQAANGNRRGLTIYNDSTKILFLKLGSAASQTDFSVKLSAQGYYETPANYTGIVTGLWNQANGVAYVTEILD